MLQNKNIRRYLENNIVPTQCERELCPVEAL